MEPPLRLAMQVLRFLDASLGNVSRLGGLDLENQVPDGRLGPRQQVLGARLGPLDALPDFRLLVAVTRLACPRDVQERTAHVMIADLDRSLALVRHVAIGTR